MAVTGENDLQLHYINKIHDALKENGQAINRTGLLLFLFSIGIIALSFGLASTDQAISVVGLKLIFPFWIILGGGALIIEALFIFFCSLNLHRTSLRRILKSLYESAGYKEDTFNSEADVDVILNPDFITLIGEPSMGKVATSFDHRFISVTKFLFLFFLDIFPIAAILIAYFKIITQFNWLWFLLIPVFMLAFLIAILYFYVSLKNYQ
jgi:hypothetical protein